ncbi:MAG: porin family protein [Saprospiraceae bacterium]
MKPSFARSGPFLAVLPVAFCLLLCFQPGRVQAQETPQRFGAGLIFGLTASQIDGDQSAGFNKLGIQAGLRGITRLGKRTDGSIEILYTQRGAQTRLIKGQYYDPTNFFTLRLNYIEVPVQWHFKDWRVKGEDGDPDWYKAAFNVGLAYARYMGPKKNDFPQGLDIVALDYFKKNDLALVIGANILFSQHFGMTFRYVRSIVSMYDPRDYNPAPYQSSLVSRCLYFQTFYLF